MWRRFDHIPHGLPDKTAVHYSSIIVPGIMTGQSLEALSKKLAMGDRRSTIVRRQFGAHLKTVSRKFRYPTKMSAVRKSFVP
jgi:hypothetical protein